MEIGVEHADGRRRFFVLLEQAFGHQQRLVAHAALDFAALAVDAVKRGGQLSRAAGVVGQQAFDAQCHVGQTPCGVDARA